MERIGKKTIIVVCVGGTVVFVVSGGAILAGFGTAGIVKGSVAAGIQSGIGNVAAGSLFAAFQSLGAKFILLKACISSGLTTTTVGGFWAYLKSRGRRSAGNGKNHNDPGLSGNAENNKGSNGNYDDNSHEDRPSHERDTKVLLNSQENFAGSGQVTLHESGFSTLSETTVVIVHVQNPEELGSIARATGFPFLNRLNPKVRIFAATDPSIPGSVRQRALPSTLAEEEHADSEKEGLLEATGGKCPSTETRRTWLKSRAEAALDVAVVQASSLGSSLKIVAMAISSSTHDTVALLKTRLGSGLFSWRKKKWID